MAAAVVQRATLGERHGPERAAAPAGGPASPRVLIEMVLGQHGFGIDTIADHPVHLEHRRLGHARDEAIYVAAVAHPGLSLAAVSELFKRDVSTIIRGQQSFQRRLLADQSLAARVFRLIAAATGGRR